LLLQNLVSIWFMSLICTNRGLIAYDVVFWFEHAYLVQLYHRQWTPLWKPYRNSIFQMSTPLNKRSYKPGDKS
jgi:hypothetical protein